MSWSRPRSEVVGRMHLGSRTLGPARIATLAIVPLGLFILAAVMRTARGPYHLGANSDPDYAYLTNALNVVSLQAPDMFEHPGTTVEMLGAVAILARWLPSRLTSSAASIQDAVLANPEEYLLAISTLFALMVSMATFAAGLQGLRTWRKLPPALAIQVSLLLFAQVAAALPRVTPEPLLIVAALLLVTAVIPVAAADAGSGGRGRWTLAVLVGTAMGFGLATKFTFMPLLGFVMLLPGHVGKALAVAACILGFIAFTLPVAVYYSYMRNWLETLATHKGVNGSGDAGLPDPGTLMTNVVSLVPVATPLFALAMICALLAFGLSFWHGTLPSDERVRMRNLFAVSGLVVAAQIVLTAKQPSGHYLLPSMPVASLATASITLLVMRTAGGGFLLPARRLGLIAVLIAGLVNGAVKDVGYASQARAYAEDAAAFEPQLTPKDASTIAYYGSSQLEYALAFGNDFAKNRYGVRLRQLYPDALFYSIWERRFYSFAGDVRGEEIRRLVRSGRTVLMDGLPLDDGYAAYQKGLILEPVMVGSGEAIYRLIDMDLAELSTP
jgi:hypothetical protein